MVTFSFGVPLTLSFSARGFGSLPGWFGVGGCGFGEGVGDGVGGFGLGFGVGLFGLPGFWLPGLFGFGEGTLGLPGLFGVLGDGLGAGLLLLLLPWFWTSSCIKAFCCWINLVSSGGKANPVSHLGGI